MQNTLVEKKRHLNSAEDLFQLFKDIDMDNPLCSYSRQRCEKLYPYIKRIESLKTQKNAIILAHSYVHPDIIYGVADHTGDSFALSMIAKESQHDRIVFPSVRFMAETAKILNPSKIVIDPNPNGGCSLAESIDALTVRKLRDKHPKHTFVCYINTTAEVKAACDVCVTSSNVYKIIENIPSDKIFFLPDALMGKNLVEYVKEQKINKEILYYDNGSCYVHESFDPSTIQQLKREHKNLRVLAHPECSPSVVKEAEMVSSTSGLMTELTKNAKPNDLFLLLTECGIATRLKVERPDIRLIGACMMCKYMKANHLEHILQSLEEPKDHQIIHIPKDILAKAQKTIDAMFVFGS
jgi:quinolinate synthase